MGGPSHPDRGSLKGISSRGGSSPALPLTYAASWFQTKGFRGVPTVRVRVLSAFFPSLLSSFPPVFAYFPGMGILSRKGSLHCFLPGISPTTSQGYDQGAYDNLLLACSSFTGELWSVRQQQCGANPGGDSALWCGDSLGSREDYLCQIRWQDTFSLSALRQTSDNTDAAVLHGTNSHSTDGRRPRLRVLYLRWGTLEGSNGRSAMLA